MFDVSKPLQSERIDEYRKSWELFFLMLGLTKRNGAWQIVHEHHSALHKLNQ